MNNINLIELLFSLFLIVFLIKKIFGEYGNNEKDKNIDKDVINFKQEKKKAVIRLVDKGEFDIISHLKELDERFTEESFLEGAKRAFVMIVTAFNKGELSEVKDYISKDIYQNFSEVIIKRKEQGIVSGFEFIGFTEASIKKIKVTGTIASITVMFNTEQESYLEDKEGNIIKGAKNHLLKFSDIWTFTRNTKNKDPNWTLTATQNI